MAKFPTEVERSVTVKAPIADVYKYLWDVAGSSPCIPGIDRCEPLGEDTYRFIFAERSTGPVSMTVCYTARYAGNGSDRISFEGMNADGDNTEVKGSIKLTATGADSTKITIKQMLAPDTPVPRLLQSFLKSYVESESAAAVKDYLANLKKAFERNV